MTTPADYSTPAAIQRLFTQLSPRLAARVTTDLAARRAASQDYNWYSPVLNEQLSAKVADLAVWPASVDELRFILSAAFGEQVAVTIRGGGTGNYGQCVPLHGGVVVDTSRLKRILDIGPGYARVEAGVRLGQLERAVQATGQELCIYPSTFLTAAAAGFVGGGSGGIGSITHGNLWDGNVLAATVLPAWDDPQDVTISGDGLRDVIHAYGTTGVIADVTLRLAPRVPWVQLILTLPTQRHAVDFCFALCNDDNIEKRLVTLTAQPITAYFNRTKKLFPDGGTLVFAYVRAGQDEAVRALVSHHHGQLDAVLPETSKMRLSDFTWNHTTLYALKADPQMTYMQARLSGDPTIFHQQVAAIEARYGTSFLLHVEFIRANGLLAPSGLPLFPYQGLQHLAELIAFLNEIGCSIADPHTWVVEDGGRGLNGASMLAMKQRMDPALLLNPGKLKAAAPFERPDYSGSAC